MNPLFGATKLFGTPGKSRKKRKFPKNEENTEKKQNFKKKTTEKTKIRDHLTARRYHSHQKHCVNASTKIFKGRKKLWRTFGGHLEKIDQIGGQWSTLEDKT